MVACFQNKTKLKSTGSSGNHVITNCYPAEFQSFDGNGDRLDEWVFKEAEKMFVQARKNETLNTQLHQDKIVFFLYLQGLDCNGHTYHPNSP